MIRHFTIRFTDTGERVEDLHLRRLNPARALQASENQTTEGDAVSAIETQEIPEPTLCARVTKWTKRTDFLHKVSSSNTSKKSETCAYLPLSTCTVDNLPVSYAQVALLLPSILHHIENTFVTDHLCETLLSSIPFKRRALIDTAITATSACEADNYQNLELLGDTCLKIYASITIMSQHLNWHEGYLTHQKDHLVSNGRLALAAQQTGLDQYIRTKTFTGLKWRPKYIEDLLAESSAETRDLSSKTLADVVEALLGAAYLDGGETRILGCLSLFLPEMLWRPLAECREILLGASTPEDYIPFPAHFVHLEYLIGHVFTTKPLLLEALTHPSHLGPDKTPSYDRLEFCGDSVLDFIITTRIFRHSSLLSTFRMHLLRTAMVNANFLGFVCMSRSILLSSTMSITRISAPHAKEVPLAIWHFMRHSHSYDMITAQSRCHARFVTLQPAINDALNYGKSYPWTLLCTLGPEKFFSDLIESVIAAIYIDTAGSLPACERFLTALGIIPYLDRALKEDIHVMHPKEELGVLAGNETVNYVLVDKDDDDCEGLETGKTSGGKRRPKGYQVKVLVGGEVAAISRGARTRIEAETKAAEEAIMRLNKGLFKLGGNADKQKSSSGKGDLSSRRALLDKKAASAMKPRPLRKVVPERKAKAARTTKATRVNGEDSSDEEDEALDDVEVGKDMELVEHGEFEDYVEPDFAEEERLGEVKQYEIDENGIVYDAGDFDEDRVGREDSIIFGMDSVRPSEDIDERKVVPNNRAMANDVVVSEQGAEDISMSLDRGVEMDEDGIVFDNGDTDERKDSSPGIVFEDEDMGVTEQGFPSLGSSASVSVTLTYRNSQACPHKCERVNPRTGKRCKSAFSRPSELARHEATVHSSPRQRFRCQLCAGEKSFSRKDALSKHMRVVHSEVDSHDNLLAANGRIEEDAELDENGVSFENGEVGKAIKTEEPGRRSPIRFFLPDQRKSRAKVNGTVEKKLPPPIQPIASSSPRTPKKPKVKVEEVVQKKAPPPAETRFRFVPRVLNKSKEKMEAAAERKAAPRMKSTLCFESHPPKKREVEEDGIVFDVEEVEEELESRAPTPARSPMEFLLPASITPEVMTPVAITPEVATPEMEVSMEPEEDGILYDDEVMGDYEDEEGRNGNGDELMSDYDILTEFL
jgi:dsRNA-specific ribonuclease